MIQIHIIYGSLSIKSGVDEENAFECADTFQCDFVLS